MVDLRKIPNNFGADAVRALGAGGYARYLAAALGRLPAIARAGNLRPLDEAMRGIVVLRHPVDRSEVRIDLDAYRPGDEAEGSYAFGLVREIWIRDVYLASFDLPAGLGCVIDLGANRGIFSLQAAAISDRVIAVEPMEGYATPLARNMELNGFDNISLVRAMVGGTGQMDVDGARRMELGTIMRMAGELPVDLLKIDIEGSEFGLDMAPLRQARRLAMEIHPDWGDPAALVECVRNLGFDCRTFDESLRPVPPARADFMLALNLSSPGPGWRAGAAPVPDNGESPE